jgi:hypothetical protein
MQQYNDDAFEERGLLRDGHRYRVSVTMQDSLQRDVAASFQRRRASDSAAFPRPRNRCYVVDGQGGTQGLHRPGYRLTAGGHAGDKALRDATDDETERAYDAYNFQITNAWRRRDPLPAEADDDVELEARAAAIRTALLTRGHDHEYVEAYLDSLDEDELLDGSIGDHVQAFEKHLQALENGRDARTLAADRKSRLKELYRQRDAELEQQWRRR